MKFDPQGWYLDRGHWGGLRGILIAPRNATPSIMVTLCHGFGAPGTDLVSLAEEIVPLLPDDVAAPAFFFPSGPIDLGELYGMEGANAWWPLNMAMLAELAATDRFDALHDKVPEGIDSARRDLTAAIQACAADHQWTHIRHILGGFSQGSMLAVDTAMHATELDIRGVVIWSGALICKSVWEGAQSSSGRRVPTYQSHGRQDMILPVSTGRALHQFLVSVGWHVTWFEFDGPHTIPGDGLEGLAHLIQRVEEGA